MKFNKRILELAAKFGPSILPRGLIFLPANSSLLKELNSLKDQEIKDLIEYLDNFSSATINDYDKVLAAHERNLREKNIDPGPLLKYLMQATNLKRSSPLRSLADYKDDREKATQGVASFKKITADLIRLTGDANEVDIKDDDFNAMLKAENDKAQQTKLEKPNPAPIPAAAAAAPSKEQLSVSAPRGWRKVEVKIPEHLLPKGPGFHKQVPSNVAPSEKVTVRPFEEKEFEISGAIPQSESRLKPHFHIIDFTAEDIAEFDPEKTHGVFIQTIKAIQTSLANNKQEMPKIYQGQAEFHSFIQSLIGISNQIEENKYNKETSIKEFLATINLLENQIGMCIHQLDDSPKTKELKKELGKISELIIDFYIQSRKPDVPAPTYSNTL